MPRQKQYHCENSLIAYMPKYGTYAPPVGQWQYPTYNALGQRVEDYQGTATTSLKLYYPWDIFGERTGIWDDHSSVGWVGWDVYWSQVAGQRLNMGGSSAYIGHSDAVGSTTMETDPAGGVQWDMTHYPWGQIWQQTGTRQTGVYAGLDWQVNDPLIPSATRELSPALGRWMTPDSMGGDIMNPQSLNRYAYVLNNPTTLNDPLGLDAGDPMKCSYDKNGALHCDPTGGGDNGGSCSDSHYAYMHLDECHGRPTCSFLGDPNCCAGPDIGGDNAELCYPMSGNFPPRNQWNPLPSATQPTAAGQLGALAPPQRQDVPLPPHAAAILTRVAQLAGPPVRDAAIWTAAVSALPIVFEAPDAVAVGYEYSMENPEAITAVTDFAKGFLTDEPLDTVPSAYGRIARTMWELLAP